MYYGGSLSPPRATEEEVCNPMQRSDGNDDGRW
jgi:hypothetical protein